MQDLPRLDAGGPPQAGAGGARDTAGLEAAYETHHDRVLALCRRLLHDDAAAEDACHEAFVRAAPHLGHVDDVAAYLARAARNICNSEYRRRASVERAHPRSSSADIVVDPQQIAVDRALLREVWPMLSARQRRVVSYRWMGLTCQEIAHRLGVSVAVVTVGLHRTRRKAADSVSHLPAWLLPVFWPVRRWLRWRALPRSRTVRRGVIGGHLVVATVLSLSLLPAILPAANGPDPGVRATEPVPAAPPAVAVASRGPAGAPSRVRAATPATARSSLSAATAVATPRAPSGIPQDAEIRSVAVSPSYSGDHTVYAAGYRLSDIPVLYRSTDGGATWQRLPALGYHGGRVLLPPSFPRDPTIFAVGGVMGSVLERSDDGGQTFQPVMPAFSASIAPDSAPGAALIAVATPAGILLYDAATRTVSAPWIDPQPAVPDLVAVGADHNDVYAVETFGAPGSNELVHCIVPRCQVVASLAKGANDLQVSPDFGVDKTVVVVLGDSEGVLVSHDDGRSFDTIAVPAGWSISSLSFLRESGGVDVSVNMWRATTSGVEGGQLHVGDGGTVPLASALGAFAVNSLVRLPDGRLLAALGSSLSNTGLVLGVRCSVDNGQTWAPDCAR